MKQMFFFIFICGFFTACKKDVSVNPYENSDLQPPNISDTNYFPDPTAFAALHNNIFIPLNFR